MSISWILLSILISTPFLNAESNVLKNVNIKHNESRSIELCVLRLSFQKEPIFNVLPSYNQHASTVFFFPLTRIEDREYRKITADLEKHHNNSFTIRLESVTTPVEGVKLSIYHDPKVVTITHEFFQSADFQPGVIFRINNKVLLQQLESKEDAFLSTAYRFQPQKIAADFFVLSV